MTTRILIAALAMAVTVPAAAQIHDPKALGADPATATSAIAPRLTGLGQHHIPVTTDNPDSQYFFDQGFRLTLGFNHSEALRSFKEAARLDPDNAMAYWGWALVLGPNLNLPMQENVVAPAYAAMQKAIALKDGVSEKERAFIEALAVRYTDDPKAERAPLDAAYVDSMAQLHARYPDDPDAATLYAAAIMNTNPWDYWYRDGTPKGSTETILSTLQKVVTEHPDHAGAHHYLIHAVEAFRPELGVASADQLGDLMPGAGHLVHMPSHIYMRVGRYADSYAANASAAKADNAYIVQCRAQGMYPVTYYPHNIHFMVWSAMFQGRADAAMAAARQVKDKIPVDLKDDTWALNELFRSQPMFVMMRFGQWEAMLNEPQPIDRMRFMNGVWHYGRGLAHAHQGRLEDARTELAALTSFREMTAANAEYYTGFAVAGDLLTIAEELLTGEILAKEKKFPRSIAHLERAVRLEDSLRYNEPTDWYMPTRHMLGAVLLEAGLPTEAETVYWEDLRRNPNNGYALFGLHQSLKAQNNAPVAAEIEKRLAVAWKDADKPLQTSRY